MKESIEKTDEDAKKKPRGFFGNFFSRKKARGPTVKNLESFDKSMFAKGYLLKKEKEKGNKLLVKLNHDYLQPNFKLYQHETIKIIQSKLTSHEYEGLESLEVIPFFIKALDFFEKNKANLSEEERKRFFHFLGKIRQLILLKNEMNVSKDAEKYYQVAFGLAQFQQLFSHLYRLIEHLTLLVDAGIEQHLKNYFEKSLIPPDEKARHDPGAKDISYLRELFQQLSSESKADILQEEAQDALMKNILEDVGLSIAKEIKNWVIRTGQSFQAETAEPLSSFADESGSSPDDQLPRMHIELDIKDIDKVSRRFKQLQERLEPNQLKKQVVDFIRAPV